MIKGGEKVQLIWKQPQILFKSAILLLLFFNMLIIHSKLKAILNVMWYPVLGYWKRKKH